MKKGNPKKVKVKKCTGKKWVKKIGKEKSGGKKNVCGKKEIQKK